MNKRYLCIGIDPDTEENGFAVWNSNSKSFIEIKSLSFWDVIAYLYTNNTSIRELRIEAGWLIKKSNWHPSQGANVRERIAKDVGSNHQVGKLIAAYCDRVKIPYRLIKPMGKLKGPQFQKLTGYKKRLNQDKRDAAMLVFGL